MAKATGETIWWSLFAAGGVVAAMLIPALILITGILLPFTDAQAFRDVEILKHVQFPGYPVLRAVTFSLIGRLVLFVAISLTFFHCAHRIVHTSKDLGLHAAHGLIAFLFYGGAIVGTGVAVWVIWL
jgi:fumarate reductase subunit D